MLQIPDIFTPLLDRKDKHRFYVFYGGRDSTKSWSVAICLISLAFTNKDLLIVCAKGTMNSLSDSVKSLIENLIKHMGLEDYFRVIESEIECVLTGSRFIFKGLQNPDRLKSLEGADYLWIEEANIDTKEKTFDTVVPTIRKPGNKIILTFNPKFEDDFVYTRFVLNPTEKDYVRKITWKNNPFLSQESKDEIDRVRETDIVKYNHIYGGELLQEVTGALWNRELIKYIYRDEYIEIVNKEYSFNKIVVAVDPSVTNKITSDACGIIVAAEDKGRYIVLEDASNIMSPEQWASKAVALFDQYKADHIVYESNQGGDLVKSILRKYSPSARVLGVHASRGKITRAEPILLLYEQDKVRHIKAFKDLEYEMITYTGDPKDKSPNRLDALVWALTDLSQANLGPKGYVPGNMGTMRLRAGYR